MFHPHNFFLPFFTLLIGMPNDSSPLSPLSLHILYILYIKNIYLTPPYTLISTQISFSPTIIINIVRFFI